MTETYLRRRPARAGLHPALRRAIAAAAAVLLFAVIDTAASIRVTSLTRDVQVGEETIASLESELSYLVRDRERYEREHAVGKPTPEENVTFAAPDSGSVVILSMERRSRPLQGGL
jgi:hypothetical protein